MSSLRSSTRCLRVLRCQSRIETACLSFEQANFDDYGALKEHHVPTTTSASAFPNESIGLITTLYNMNSFDNISTGDAPISNSFASPKQTQATLNAGSPTSTTPGSPRAPPLVGDALVLEDFPHNRLDASTSSNERHQLSLPSSPPNGSRSSISLSDTPSVVSNENDGPEKNEEEIAREGLEVARKFVRYFSFALSLMCSKVQGKYKDYPTAHQAREMKRFFDRALGVGKNGVRSPYAITALKSSEGNDIFRVVYAAFLS